MNIAFRLDASGLIGSGHLMRCLTLAEKLRVVGVRTRFVCRGLASSYCDLIRCQGHELTLLVGLEPAQERKQLAHASWLPVSQSYDAEECIRLNDDVVWHWWVVDHYALDSAWEVAIGASGARILVIDDLFDRRHACDIVLNQNLCIDEFPYKKLLDKEAVQLIGPKYSLIRDEFVNLRSAVTLRVEPKKILIFLGGVDAQNFTQVALEAIHSLTSLDADVTVIIGIQHPSVAIIGGLCAKYGYSFVVQTNQISKYMLDADLAIGGAGSACWERCIMGLPTLLVSIAKNQEDLALNLAQAGGAIYLGKQQDVNETVICDAVTRLADTPQKFKELSLRCLSLVDGLGTNRILTAMGIDK